MVCSNPQTRRAANVPMRQPPRLVRLSAKQGLLVIAIRRGTMLYMKSTARKLTAIRIEQRLLDTLAKIGAKRDRTVSYLIRKAVEEFVERHGDKS
jgi:hypothetical protein